MKKILILIIVAAIWGCSDEEKSSDPRYLPGKEYRYSGPGLPENRDWTDYFDGLKKIEEILNGQFLGKFKDCYTVSLGDSGEIRQGSHYTNLNYDFFLSFDKYRCSIHYLVNIDRKTSYIHGVYKYYKFKETRIIEEYTEKGITRDIGYVIRKDGLYLIDFVGTDDSVVYKQLPYFTGDYEFKYLADGKEVLRNEVQQIDSLETFTYRLVQDSILILENSEKKIRGVFRNNYKDLDLEIDLKMNSGFEIIDISERTLERK